MFILPDDVLEELTCDICHKYLSVGPIKVDNNHNRKCGRCARKDPTGVTSIYQHFLQHAIFKCINRFQGCNELLTHKQVFEHENKCNKHQPTLFDNRKMQTYDFLYQFKKENHKNYLKKPFLQKTLNELKELNQFLYLKDNYIFSIFVKFERCIGKISFNAYYVGGENKVYDIQQKYNVLINKTMKLETPQQSCLPLTEMNEFNLQTNVIQTEYSQNVCSVVINFEFITPSVIHTNELFIVKEMSSSTAIKERTIYEAEHYKGYLGKYNIAINHSNRKLSVTTIDGNKIEIQLECMLCSKIGEDNIYITTSGKSRQLICFWCGPVVKTHFCLLDSILKYGVYSLKYYVTFSCIWSCGILNTLADIEGHELNCEKKNEPKIKCPMPNCFFNGMFDLMKNHLWNEHNERFWSSFVILYETYKTYPNHNILSLADKTQFFVWVHPTVLLKCIIDINNDKTVTIRTECVDKSTYCENLSVVAFNNEGQYLKKYYIDFLNKSDKIDLGVFPIRLHFIVK